MLSPNSVARVKLSEALERNLPASLGLMNNTIGSKSSSSNVSIAASKPANVPMSALTVNFVPRKASNTSLSTLLAIAKPC